MITFTPDVIKNLEQKTTPFYYYNLTILRANLRRITEEAKKFQFNIHYALKANCNSKLLNIIQQAGLGADCVSGEEVKTAIAHGFKPNQIMFAGVGKTDHEIIIGLQNNIACFNCESFQEIQVINQLAQQLNTTASVAIRINPNVAANTHKYITTGLEENKFGINEWELPQIFSLLNQCKNISLIGIHFHIGSQITDLSVFSNLCNRVNQFQLFFKKRGIALQHINVGGGLGVDYQNPDTQALTNFEAYFEIFNRFLEREPNQTIHFEIGRALVAQCGNLISKALYIKNGVKTNFIILDAGMTELIRPALYQAYHKIENLSKYHLPATHIYDIVGPVCESSDCFGKAVQLPETQRGDLIAIRSAGAYGEVMAFNYNLRKLNPPVFSNEL